MQYSATRVPFRVIVFFVLSVSAFATFADTVYYFQGDPADQVNKATTVPPTATFNETAPTGGVPIVQTTTPLANADFIGNPLAASWSGAYSGSVSGVLDLQWYWSTANPATLALSSDVEVTVFADPDWTADDPVQPGKIIGRAIVPLTGIGATPTLVQNLIPVNGTVTSELLIQVVPQFVDTGNGIFIHYASTMTPSSFTIHDAPPRIAFPAATQAPGYAPRYKVYNPTAEQLASGVGHDAAEPSIGVNWFTDKVMFMAMLQTLRVTFDDACSTTPSAVFENKSSPITSQITFDPILYTDRYTGRTIAGQLLFPTTDSASAYTDDDGESWFPSQGAGIASGIDHQTIGGGQFHQPRPAGALWSTAVYYCAQDLALANCALSLDGGRTYGPAVPVYGTQCGGLHGHIKVGPDGTAYLPNKGCSGEQAVVVSEDNGMTWEIRKVPGSLAANSDPSVAIARDGRVYFGFVDNDNHMVVGISDDKGRTWTNLKDVGKLAGIENAVFPAMVAGDRNRAAVAYIGTTTTGSLQAREFPGVWHMYISTTYDGGNTWHTVNATPNDPVQRGPIWLKGGGEISRNLLDFMDATIDREGRVLVGYADGCLGDCVQAPPAARGNTYEDISAIIRQSGGRRMFSEYDPAEPTEPGAPTLTVTRNGSVARVTWSQANNGGIPGGYTVHRRVDGGNETVVASLGSSATGYNDPIDADKTYTYRVSSTNSVGASCGSNAVTSAPRGNSCTTGVKVLNDAAGDQTGAPLNASHDIQSVSIAEPYYADSSRKLTFIVKVGSLATLPPLSQWRLIWNFPTTAGGQYYADMRTDANGAVSFEYGEVLVTSAVITSVGQPSRLGDADPESSYSADGTIRIVLSTTKIGDLAAGDLIGGLVARTYIGAGEAATSFRAALDTAEDAQTYRVVGNGYCAPPVITCIEENDASIAYTPGWFSVNSANASAGHFYMGAGPASATLSFEVPAGRFGAVTYHYGSSRKGGTAEVFVDGVSQGTIDYLGFVGDTAADAQFGLSRRFSGFHPGTHTIEIRANDNGTIYIDQFCLESSRSNAQPDSGPGETMSSSGTVGLGGNLLTQLTLPANATSISVVTEATGGLARVLLIGPGGATLATAETNAKGLATIQKPVTGGGLYLVKAINLSLGPIKVWTAVTPTVRR